MGLGGGGEERAGRGRGGGRETKVGVGGGGWRGRCTIPEVNLTFKSARGSGGRRAVNCRSFAWLGHHGYGKI